MPGHWWILIVLAAVVFLLLWAPRLLPKLGSRLGRGVHELKDASVEAGKNLRQEAAPPPDDKTEPPA